MTDSYTTVELWIGSAQHPRSVCDVFSADELTVTSIDTDQPVRVYKAGEWKHATTFAPGGHPLYTFKATTPARQLNTDLLKRKTA